LNPGRGGEEFARIERTTAPRGGSHETEQLSHRLCEQESSLIDALALAELYIGNCAKNNFSVIEVADN